MLLLLVYIEVTAYPASRSASTWPSRARSVLSGSAGSIAGALLGCLEAQPLYTTTSRGAPCTGDYTQVYNAGRM